ncbi:hypothetical protein P168DRAFT_10052 [Aspergillus campestris IBT 28561]|uniref:Uncharacterized protein n=1 Tax=Aspergillus campestris (strain IBT 28561) TaxID=1392248 RepID=A0A2I1DE51_ASPC2|nr:uncharacterized protein P168DRAFT_10052 [Aspergillus campestris IBT 28561]PKY08158.1 hypothetical protein P168DRAFT_10052 [Aspergillus campestris IBT 28561]
MCREIDGVSHDAMAPGIHRYRHNQGHPRQCPPTNHSPPIIITKDGSLLPCRVFVMFFWKFHGRERRIKDTGICTATTDNPVWLLHVRRIGVVAWVTINTNGLARRDLPPIWSFWGREDWRMGTKRERSGDGGGNSSTSPNGPKELIHRHS